MITAIHCLSMQHNMSYSSRSCFVSLTGSYIFVYLVLEQFKFGYLSTVLILTTGCSTLHLMAKLSLRISELFGCSPQRWLGYKKFSNSLELSYSGQCRTEVFQDGFHSEQTSQGSIKDD